MYDRVRLLSGFRLAGLFRNVGQLLRVQEAAQHLLLLPHLYCTYMCVGPYLCLFAGHDIEAHAHIPSSLKA